MLENNDRILRRAQVYKLTGLGRSAIDKMEQRGEFPRRRQISERLVGWSALEVQAWIDNKLHGETTAAP